MQPVLQRHRPLTSMENLQLASQMVKADRGLIKSMLSKVSETAFALQHFWWRIVNSRLSLTAWLLSDGKSTACKPDGESGE